jgi:hypothetical protein
MVLQARVNKVLYGSLQQKGKDKAAGSECWSLPLYYDLCAMLQATYDH